MAAVSNPRKVFQFKIEIDGVDQMEVQKCTLPDMETEVVKHGDTNHDVKTAGRVTVGNLKLEKLRALPTSDQILWNWQKSAQNITTGGGAIPALYKKVVIVKEMDASGLITVARWILTGVWPTKRSQADFDRMSSDNQIETLEFSVDTMDQLPV